MATLERQIRGYQLIMTGDLDNFNEAVNSWIEDGYQFMNDEGVRLEWQHNDPVFRAEMVRYVPERHEIDLRAMAGRPMEETNVRVPPSPRAVRLAERDRMTEAVNRVMADMPAEAFPTREEDLREETEPIRERNFLWTADSPDPFDDDEDMDEDEVNDHQLNRLGALRREFDDEMDAVMETTDQQRMTGNTREAQQIMREQFNRTREVMDRAETIMERSFDEPQAPQQDTGQTETVMDMMDNAPF